MKVPTARDEFSRFWPVRTRKIKKAEMASNGKSFPHTSCQRNSQYINILKWPRWAQAACLYLFSAAIVAEKSDEVNGDIDGNISEATPTERLCKYFQYNVQLCYSMQHPWLRTVSTVWLMSVWTSPLTRACSIHQTSPFEIVDKVVFVEKKKYSVGGGSKARTSETPTILLNLTWC